MDDLSPAADAEMHSGTEPDETTAGESVIEDGSTSSSSSVRHGPSPGRFIRGRPWKALVKPRVLKYSMSDWLRIMRQPLDRSSFLHAFYRKDPASVNSELEVADQSGNLVFDRARDEPHRIVIESFILTQEIKEAAGISFPNNALIFKPPFKTLVQFWPELKQRLEYRKNEETRLRSPVNVNSAQVPAAEDKTAPVTPRSRDGSAGPDYLPDTAGVNVGSLRVVQNAVNHLQAFIDFGETALKHHFEIREKVQDGSLQKIAFDDLYHLFSPGDILLSNDRGQPQLYQAYFVTGGQPRLRGPTTQEKNSPRNIVRRTRSRTPTGRRAWHDADVSSSSSDDGTSTLKDAMAGSWTLFTIDCFYFNIDSTGVGTSSLHKHIMRYVGEKNILDLPIYPLRFHKNSDMLLKRLEERGRDFVLCQGHKRYDGFTYDNRGRSSRQRLQGEVYVDLEEYSRSRSGYFRSKLGVLRRTNPTLAEVEEQSDTPERYYIHHDHEVDEFKSDAFIATTPEIQDVITRDEALESPHKLRLMGHRISAFSFRSRSWVNLEIDEVNDIDKSELARESGFHDLCIPTKHRRLLISLVDNHTSKFGNGDQGTDINARPSTQLDLVRGKGLGLIVLLHGPPGTGKTSTAETIAAHTGRPLYAITCGDLGEEVADIENRLDVHSKRADRWGCVLLLDEADVFLMRRDWKDTKRNAMVSIFLRTLEYFGGILFLTTNRVGVIDEAFKSRMHVSLRYPRVKLKPTLDIWKNMLDRIERDNEYQEIKVVFDRDELMEFAETHYDEHHETHSTWNGRQIRNAFQTAIALGQYDRITKMRKKGLTLEEALLSGKKKWRVVELTRKNLETIAETAQDFDKYLQSVHRGSDGELAKAEDLRDDEFSEPDEIPVRRTFLSPKPAAKSKKKSKSNWVNDTDVTMKAKGKRPQNEFADEYDSSAGAADSEKGQAAQASETEEDSD